MRHKNLTIYTQLDVRRQNALSIVHYARQLRLVCPTLLLYMVLWVLEEGAM